MTAPTRIARSWRLGIRRALPADRDAVLAFATTTWDGWDYIPQVWDDWLADEVGAFLVGTAEPGPDGQAPTDRDGAPLDIGQVVAITHLAMLSPTEAWVEGIRVDPRVRGMDIATDLQAGVLDAARERGATAIRYVTGEVNEGSLHLGARHGLLPVAYLRFHGREREDDRLGPTGTAAVEATLAAAERDGVLLRDPADAGAWFARLVDDPTFRAGHGLYEHTSWAQEALTEAKLADRIAAGEVLALGPDEHGRWVLLIVNRAESLADGELLAALLAGDGGRAVELLERLGGEPGPLARLRLPDPAPIMAGHEADWLRLGYRPHEGRMVIVERVLIEEA
jgi:GNAT superfamily N-acetyltransferase